MRIVIAGGHGQIALRLERLLAERGDTPIGLIRSAEQADELRTAGAEPLVLDLEEVDVSTLAAALDGADAVVFAAGAGPGSSTERKDTVDRQGAVTLAEAAVRAGVQRYLLLSSMGADADASDEQYGESFGPYLRAKGRAEDEVCALTSLEVTVLRPGALTDDPGTGRVQLAESVERGKVTRDDVAAVLLALLAAPGSAGQVLELVAGEVQVQEAVRAATG